MMNRWLHRLGWMALGMGALYAFSAMAGVVSGGSLDPPGPVGSTMKSLDDIPPSWHRILAADDGSDACDSSRFECVMGDAAVLDRETGLVWEQAPSTNQQNWFSAIRYCQQAQIGGRYGWRSPSVEELRSLLDDTGFLPAGVFTVQATDYYWSSTVDPATPSNGPLIQFSTAGGGFAAAQKDQFAGFHAWCVRGAGSAGSHYQGGPLS